jgi:hypothetical protein
LLNDLTLIIFGDCPGIRNKKKRERRKKKIQLKACDRKEPLVPKTLACPFFLHPAGKGHQWGFCRGWGRFGHSGGSVKNNKWGGIAERERQG